MARSVILLKSLLNSLTYTQNAPVVILLQIVMVSPWTHLERIMRPSPEPLNPSSKHNTSIFLLVSELI